jgi:hypothetical protein
MATAVNSSKKVAGADESDERDGVLHFEQGRRNFFFWFGGSPQ